MTRVEAYDPSGASTILWEGTDTTACGTAFEIAIDGPNYAAVNTNTIRIHTSKPGDYEEVDAVQLCGNVVPFPPTAPPQPPAPPFAPPPCTAPVDLVLVVDKSSSVAGERAASLSFAREIVASFELSATAAQIGFVEFCGTVGTPTPLTSSLATILNVIDTAPTYCSNTFLSGGIDAGQSIVTGTGARAGVPKVLAVLISNRRGGLAMPFAACSRK